jgi:hypothetical protein
LTTITVGLTGGAVAVEVTTMVAVAVAVVVAMVMQRGWMVVVMIVGRRSLGIGAEATRKAAAKRQKKNVKKDILTVMQVSR